MIIIGIDPGYDRMGVAVIERELNKEMLVFSCCIETDRKQEIPDRLFVIGKEVEKIFTKHKPDVVGVENLFFNTNQKTAMGVSMARGIVTYLAKCSDAQVAEYTPPQIKTAVAGHGHADKKQVIDMVSKLIKIEKEIKHDDEYDAIAVALTASAML